jgi:recombination protein RecA
VIRKKQVSAAALATGLSKVPEVDTLLAIRDRGASVSVKSFTTGCYNLDVAAGRGGWPQRRLSVLWGPEGVGKTTLALHGVAEAQKRGVKVIYMDPEYKLEPDYATALGVDMDKIILSYPFHVEACFALMKEAIRIVGGEELLIFVDSTTSLPPKSELETYSTGADPTKPGQQAAAFSISLRNFCATLGRSNTAVVFVSQTRVKFGSKYDQITSGNAIRFYASLMVRLRYIGGNTDSKERERSMEVEAVVTKNSIGIPFKRADYTIRFGKGIDQLGSLVKAGIDSEVVTLAGGWYQWRGNKWQGSEKFANFLGKSSEAYDTLKRDIYEKLP